MDHIYEHRHNGTVLPDLSSAEAFSEKQQRNKHGQRTLKPSVHTYHGIILNFRERKRERERERKKDQTRAKSSPGLLIQ